MHTLYLIVGFSAATFIVGVLFSPGITRFFVRAFTDVKQEYEKALAETKALYEADKAAFDARVKNITDAYGEIVAKLKADLGEANNKVSALTSVIQGATVLAPAAASAPTSPPATTTRTKAQIAADLADAQAREAQLQADLATATD